MSRSTITDSQMDDATREMARRRYGYGRWDAPYWFIGPEEGQAPGENLDTRLEAWRHLGAGELNDCRSFHDLINERWHGEKPPLQSTWRPLMLLLMTFLERATDNESLRAYQRDRWGRLSGGETCVIELSGLPANNLKVPRERESFRQERIETIRNRMHAYKPLLVVMYGRNQKEHWEQIAGVGLHPDNVRKVESTIFAFAQHPAAHGLANQYWVKLGQRVRDETGRA